MTQCQAIQYNGHVDMGGIGDRLAGSGGGASEAGDITFCLGEGLKK